MHSYVYQNYLNLDSTVETGGGGENELYQQINYLPFEIAGTDSAGLRFTEQPTQNQIQSQSFYFLIADVTPTDDVGNLQSSSVLGSDGALETTFYADYNAFGQPGTVTDPQGNVTTNTYDTDGNLTETQEKDKNGNLLSESTYTYTAAVDGVAAGQVVETDSLNSQGELVPTLTRMTWMATG